jgi:threonine/homoserine/homoserine lactone efflux protein
MLGTQHLWLFVVSGLLLNITPGQDTLYIVGRTLAQGRRAGLLSVLGISTGSVIHTLAAAFGLSAILATSATAFTVVKLAGAGYLVYLGMKLLLERPAPAVGPAPAAVTASDWSVYRAGLLTNVLNPKVALFFMAFLPQFVAPDAGARLLPFLFLGAVFVFNGTLWCLVLVWTAAAMSRRLQRSTSWGLALKRASGALFVGLGARLALSK